MRMTKWGTVAVATLVAVWLMPTMGWAQQAGAVAGVVTDITGGVLPGVTVEASSPILIERVRTAVTDSNGQYRVVDLRPGTYVVTFTLPGFQILRREGIALSQNFTATVNAELVVGAVEETITVTGASPVVDVQNVLTQQVLTNDVLEAIPNSRHVGGLVSLMPGARYAGIFGIPDVGGSSGDSSAYMAIHGSRPGDMNLSMDGLRMNNGAGFGGAQSAAQTVYQNQAAVQEYSVTIDGFSAEFETAGVRINIIPKEGGNALTGFMFAAFANENFQAGNLNDELRGRGLLESASIKQVYDYNPALGGALLRDRLWFYTAHRWWGSENFVPGLYWNLTPPILPTPVDARLDNWLYSQDLSRQASQRQLKRSNNLRLTALISPQHKVSVFHDNQVMDWDRDIQRGTADPAGTFMTRYSPSYLSQVKYTGTFGSSWLVETGASLLRFSSSTRAIPGVGVTPQVISVLERSTNFRYRANRNYTAAGSRSALNTFNERFVVSYVTGAHHLSFGINNINGPSRGAVTFINDFDYTYAFLNGVPNRVDLSAPSSGSDNNTNWNLGLFVQDQWRVDRLTLNLGLRVSYLNAEVPPQTLEATRFIPELEFGGLKDVPNQKDLSPRAGLAYDVFGTGRTALKFAVGKYQVASGAELARFHNPAASTIRSATRSWSDDNGNFVPDCDLLLPAANGECDRLSPASFGTNAVLNTYDPSIVTGWNKRHYNWTVSAGVQHELVDGVSVNAMYYRRWYGNFNSLDNLEVDPTDYDPFSITGPVDSRLPGGGGEQIGDLFNINPAKFGLVDNLILHADNFGKLTNVYDGIDLTTSARLPNGVLLQGGVNIGRENYNNCDLIAKVDNARASLPHTRGLPFGLQGFRAKAPNVSGMDSPSTRFCNYAPPFVADIKLLMTYPLPWWDLQTSATFQSSPGIEIIAQELVPNALIEPSLGRPLAAGSRSGSFVQLIEPGTEHRDRMTQLDFRVSKIFNLPRGARIRGSFDLYNAFNANTVLQELTRYRRTGTNTWGRPVQVLFGRLAKFSLQMDF